MTLVLDTGPLVALADRRDPQHQKVRTLLQNTNEEILLSPFVLNEADYLVTERLGIRAELAMLADVARGAISIVPIDTQGVADCMAVIDGYRDLDVRLADASIVVIARRHRTNRIVTFDQRHFRVLQPRPGDPFVILPADKQASPEPR